MNELMIISRRVSIFAAALLAACGSEAQAPEVMTSAHGVLSEVTGFGANPGDLRMFKYAPASAPQNAPLVLALHACSQTAANYESAGWNALADRLGFYVLYPEQKPSGSQGNPARCFNWAGVYGDPTNLRRGEGENQSIIEMIDKMKLDHSIDASRIFVMGHSGGGAQTTLMMATWPDVFAGAGVIAGIPFNCTTQFSQVSSCLSPGINKTPAQWGDAVRMAHPSYSGPYPRLTIWHGTADSTVRPMNLVEILEQWSNTMGIDMTPDATDTVDGATRKAYHNAAGATVIQTVEIPGMGHGTPVRPGMGCGQTGAFFLDAGICAVERMAEFWGLDGGGTPVDRTAPTVNITAPVSGATVMSAVDVTVTAQDDVGVTRVELFINGASRQVFTAAPYRYAWDAALEASGSYSLRAVAYDAAGNQAADDDTTVTVQSTIQDLTPPTISITAPSEGATVGGTVQITVNASDDYGVARVEYLLDGASLGDSRAAPFSFAWNTAASPEGAHTLVARAYDGAGNQAEDSVGVTIERSAIDTTPPVVAFISPTDGEIVAGLITVNVSATDDSGLDTVVRLFVDDELIGTDYHPPYEMLWDTSLTPEGLHRLTLRAFDPSDNISVEEIEVTVRHGEVIDPDPTTGERVVVGKRFWGCTQTPPPSDTALPLGMVFAGWLLLSRRTRRRKASLLALMGVVLLAGCGGEDIVYYRNGDNPGGGEGAFDSGSKIFAYLDGKALTMEAGGIPSHPNGYDEDVNNGGITQCYHRVIMLASGRRLKVTSSLGTLRDAPNAMERGDCDHAVLSGELSFESTAAIIENVQGNGECFDFRVTYPGFAQEGRGSINAEGTSLVLELFFKDAAAGHYCESGAVGSSTVMLNQTPFTGDARQTYAVTE